jgi:hypothetical protein
VPRKGLDVVEGERTFGCFVWDDLWVTVLCDERHHGCDDERLDQDRRDPDGGAQPTR